MSFEYSNLSTFLGSGKSLDVSVDHIIQEMNQIDEMVSRINSETERELLRLQYVLDEYNTNRKQRGKRKVSRKWAHVLRMFHSKVRTLHSRRVRSKLPKNMLKGKGQGHGHGDTPNIVGMENSGLSFELTPEQYFRALSSPTFDDDGDDMNWSPEFSFGEGYGGVDDDGAESIISDEETSVCLNHVKYRVLNKLSETRNGGQNIKFPNVDNFELDTPLFFRLNANSKVRAPHFSSERYLMGKRITRRINKLWSPNHSLLKRRIHSK